jgi:Na+-translocating ferredoxin:NAD+ oxidoreductase RnfC subunit
MNLSEQVRLAGVVGAGGGGFPTHVKLNTRAEIVIANGAECEPLLHKDAVIMEEDAVELVRGMQLAMTAVGAGEGVIGVKGKKKHAVEAVTAASQGRTSASSCWGIIIPPAMNLIWFTTSLAN